MFTDLQKDLLLIPKKKNPQKPEYKKECIQTMIGNRCDTGVSLKLTLIFHPTQEEKWLNIYIMFLLLLSYFLFSILNLEQTVLFINCNIYIL